MCGDFVVTSNHSYTLRQNSMVDCPMHSRAGKVVCVDEVPSFPVVGTLIQSHLDIEEQAHLVIHNVLCLILRNLITSK